MRTVNALPVLLLLLTAFAPAQGTIRDVQPGPWTTKSKIPDGWVVHRTRNYEVQSQCGKEKAERLGEHMEVMNKVYRSMFRPDKAGAKRQVIKLFKDRDWFRAYGAPPSAAAYFSRSEREMVCYDTGKWSDEEQGPLTGDAGEQDKQTALEKRLGRMSDLWKMDLLGCAAHEGWHQYFAWYCVSIADPLPSWINEGMGDYFYTAAPKEVQGRKIPAQLGRTNEGRLMVLKMAARQQRLYPVERLIRMPKSEYYADGSVCYAEGWGLCQFLLHSGNKDYEDVIPDYVRAVRNDTNYDTVTEKAFKRIDLEQLDAEFRAWIDALPWPGSEPEKAEGEASDAGGGNSRG